MTKDRYSGDVLADGRGRLVRGLLEYGVVDELRLMTFLVVLGYGKRLFAEGTRTTRPSLVDSRTIGSDGVMILTFVPKDSSS